MSNYGPVEVNLRQYYNGIQLVESAALPEERPAIELASDVPVSDDYRASMNKWLRDRFGMRTVIYMVNGKAVMNPATAARLRIACQ